MPRPGSRQKITTWAVSITPPVAGDARWRSRCLERVRGGLRCRLEQNPEEREFAWADPLLSVRVRHLAGDWSPDSEIRLTYTEEPASSDKGGSTVTGTAPRLPSLSLPDDRVGELAERLVGLDAIREDVLLQLECRWGGRLEGWSEHTQTPLSPALRAQFAETVPLFIFAGDPGVGKSALARVIADQYCREAGETGRLYWLGTDRGNGLVGDLSNRVRAAFATVTRAADEGPVFLLIDEADALAMRRSAAGAHQEDRAGTATLLQSLDALQGRPVAVVLTTNLPESIDPAVQRRATMYPFSRPDRRARGMLFKQWVAATDRKTVSRAAVESEGLTAADMERALRQACLQAVRESAPLTPQLAVDHLRRHERTERV